MWHKILNTSIYVLSGILGVLAFTYPFFLPGAQEGAMGLAHSQDAPLVTAALVGLSLIALLVELQGQSISAKIVAMLGVLVAITSVLRFIEVAIPMPGGFSPIFAPIILAGYVFGGRFGFLMGSFTMLTSALVTGGVGPWLPYQMFTAGWVGLTAGWVAFLVPPAAQPGRNILMVSILSAFGFAWGLIYGVIMNVYFWPYALGPAEQSWTPGISLGEVLGRYGAFYAVTSLGWDVVRSLGNVLLLATLGAPVIRALARFRRRFFFQSDGRSL
ncbi:MAG: ECF transporter S component [Chloroflexi bacterium]|nr:ECF transporter S component [Chloroflexota bacterium]